MISISKWKNKTAITFIVTRRSETKRKPVKDLYVVNSYRVYLWAASSSIALAENIEHVAIEKNRVKTQGKWSLNTICDSW